MKVIGLSKPVPPSEFGHESCPSHIRIGHNVQKFRLISTVLGSVYARRACSPNYRPIPLSLVPPKGQVGLMVLMQLTPTTPESNAELIRSARLMSCVKKPAISPYLLSLDLARTSSSVSNLFIATTGPKISSLEMKASSLVLVKMVGSM